MDYMLLITTLGSKKEYYYNRYKYLTPICCFKYLLCKSVLNSYIYFIR